MADRIRWGIMGAAGIAGVVVPAIQASANGSVVAVAGRDQARTAAFATEHGIGRTHVGYQALLDDADVDAVYIPLPNSLHAEWAIAAAEAGKPVLCEKPLATNAAEAQRIVDVFADRGLPLMEAFMYRFHPQHAVVRDLIADGTIGTLRHVYADLSVDIMAEAASGNIRFIPELGGGALLDMGCYSVNVVRRLFGEEPASVIAVADIDQTYGVDVATTAILNFSDGRSGIAGCSFRANGQGVYRVVGTEGSIDVPRALLPGLGPRVSETIVTIVDGNGAREERSLEAVNQYRLMAEGFAAAIIDDRPVPFPPSDGVNNMRVLDAIAESARTGALVTL